MKFIFYVFALFLGFSVTAVASPKRGVQDKIYLKCEREGKKLEFNLSRATYVAEFTNVEALGHSQIPVRIPVAYQEVDLGFDIRYDWYYSAHYELRFDRALYKVENGERVTLIFNGDDMDGSFFEDEVFTCGLRK